MNLTDLTAAIKSGKTIAELVAETGIPESTLTSLAARAGVSLKAIRRAELRQKALELLPLNLTLRQGAKSLGCAPQKLQRAVPEWPVRDYMKLTDWEIDYAKQMLADGESINAAANKIGIVPLTLYKRLEQESEKQEATKRPG